MPALSMTRTLISALFNGTAWPSTAGGWQIGISTNDPAPSGSDFTEPDGGTYARLTVAADSTHWTLEAAPSDFVSNATELVGWADDVDYVANGWGLFVPAAATPWACAPLLDAVEVPAGQQLRLSPGVIALLGGGV